MTAIFSDAFNVIKKRSRILIFAVTLVYVLSFSLGFLTGSFFEFFSQERQEQIKVLVNQTVAYLGPLRGLTKSNQYSVLGTLIFLNNLKTSFLISIAGILIIPTFFFIFSNAMISGLFLGLAYKGIIVIYSPIEIFGLIFVFALELLSLIFASVEGVYLGISFLFTKKLYRRKMSRTQALKMTARETWKVYKMIIVMLVIAALLETIIIYSLTIRQVGILVT